MRPRLNYFDRINSICIGRSSVGFETAIVVLRAMFRPKQRGPPAYLKSDGWRGDLLTRLVRLVCF